MDTTEKSLDARDESLLAAILAGQTITEAAAASGMGVTTAYRRCRTPRFRVALTERHALRWSADTERMRSEVTRSIDTLIALRDGDGHPSTRLRAAVAVIELAVTLHGLVVVGPQLASLEAQLEELGDK